MSKGMKTFSIIAAIFVLGVVVFFGFTPGGRSMFHDWRTSLREVDETSYESSKIVEDTARSMIASYKSDLLTYETYIDSESEEEQSWAKQAKIRANKTAVEYNEFMLKNSHIWKENIPSDINMTLSTIE